MEVGTNDNSESESQVRAARWKSLPIIISRSQSVCIGRLYGLADDIVYTSESQAADNACKILAKPVKGNMKYSPRIVPDASASMLMLTKLIRYWSFGDNRMDLYVRAVVFRVA